MRSWKTILVVGLAGLALALSGCDLFSGGGGSDDGGGGGGAPGVPTGLAVSGPSPIGMNLSWGAVSGATSYQLYRDTSAGGSFTTLVYNNSGTSVYDIVPAFGGTYYYKVRATNSSGSSSLSSPVSGQAIGALEWVSGGDNTLWYMSNSNATLNYNKLFSISASNLTLGNWLQSNVIKNSGWTEGDLGVLFFLTDASNLWSFVIFPAGGYGVFQKSAGTWYIIKDYTASANINGTAGATNQLKINYRFSTPTYYLDFYINNTLTYTLTYGSPFPGAGGGTGFLAQIGSATDENFPSVPVWDQFAQTLPVSFLGSMASSGPGGMQDAVRAKPAAPAAQEATPREDLYQPPG